MLNYQRVITPQHNWLVVSSWFILGKWTPFMAQQFRLVKFCHLPHNITGWWFQTFFFHNIWDNPSHWPIFFSRSLKPPTRQGMKPAMGMFCILSFCDWNLCTVFLLFRVQLVVPIFRSPQNHKNSGLHKNHVHHCSSRFAPNIPPILNPIPYAPCMEYLPTLP